MSQKYSHCAFLTCFIHYRTFFAILKNMTVVIMKTEFFVSLEDVPRPAGLFSSYMLLRNSKKQSKLVALIGKLNKNQH